MTAIPDFVADNNNDFICKDIKCIGNCLVINIIFLPNITLFI